MYVAVATFPACVPAQRILCDVLLKQLGYYVQGIIRSWSLDSLFCACTLITVCKKESFESKMGERENKRVNGKSKISRFIEHKRKAR